MILHIADDSLFIDMAYRSFEAAAPGKNRFVVFSDKKNLKYIKTSKIETLSPNLALQTEFIKDIANYDFVVLHYLTSLKMQLLLRASKKTKFLWVGYGCDYYNYFEGNVRSLFLPETLALYKKKQFFLNYLRLFKRLLTQQNILFRRSLGRIDFFAPVLPNEYHLCKRQFTNLRAEFASWNYGNLEDDFSIPGLSISGNNILLGNNATYENNHIEALNAMGGFLKLDQKVICPLSYGDSDYQSLVVKYGKSILGDSFQPMIEFMPFQSYLETISNCRFVVMNHLRQQAMGNILMMMNLGSTIFLRQENPAYSFFVNIGSHVFPIERRISSGDFDRNILTSDQAQENSAILKNYWGREKMLKRTKDLISQISRKI